MSSRKHGRGTGRARGGGLFGESAERVLDEGGRGGEGGADEGCHGGRVRGREGSATSGRWRGRLSTGGGEPSWCGDVLGQIGRGAMISFPTPSTTTALTSTTDAIVPGVSYSGPIALSTTLVACSPTAAHRRSKHATAARLDVVAGACCRTQRIVRKGGRRLGKPPLPSSRLMPDGAYSPDKPFPLPRARIEHPIYQSGPSRGTSCAPCQCHNANGLLYKRRYR